MAKIFDRVKFNVSGAPNQGTCTVGTRTGANFYLPAEVGAGSQKVFYLLLNASNDEEHGIGTVASDGSTVTRDRVISSIIGAVSGTTKINVGASSVMGFTSAAEAFKTLRGVRAVVAATDTILDLDGGSAINYSRATSIAVTLPQAGSSGFYEGWFTWVRNDGVGTVTFTPTTSTINAAATLPLATGQTAFIYSDGTNYFADVMRGDLTAISAVSGGIQVTGTLNVTGNFSVATNKFNVTASNGNTAIAGTLAVTGNTTLSGTLDVVGAAGIQTGWITPPQGRLTLTSATPVMQTSVAAATTVYYTPAVGNRVPLYNGTTYVETVFAELSQTTTDTTKSPVACANNSNYDLFAWNDSGTNRCTRGPAWTSDTSRGTGAGTTELVWVNGTPLNANAITNGPGAQRGTYVGTIHTNGSATVDYIFGTTAAGGGMASFNVWNAYNRVFVCTLIADSTDSWTYSTASNWRAANNSSTIRVNMVRGLNEDGVQVEYSGVATSVDAIRTGIGLDTTGSGTTGLAGTSGQWQPSITQTSVAKYSGMPGLGFHYLSAMEYVTGTGANTFYGDAGNVVTQSGVHVSLRV